MTFVRSTFVLQLPVWEFAERWERGEQKKRKGDQVNGFCVREQAFYCRVSLEREELCRRGAEFIGRTILRYNRKDRQSAETENDSQDMLGSGGIESGAWNRGRP